MSHASSSKNCRYDVFLSFRGKDIRRTFVSHLYNALEQRGIHTFKDDERLETGKSISAELLKAIEEARFAVVIISKSYASSRWCLEELAHIIKCKNELEQIVIPVFYDVNPSDVRHQNPPFAKSFSKHEKKYTDDMEKVKRWRDAFVEAGKVSGYHLQNFKDEADCIKKLVDDIFPKSLQVISSFPESLVGMKSQVEKVASLLDMESNDVHSIGIWGMAGIGKTEIASVLYQRYRHQFQADCFLGSVGTLYQKNGLTWLAQVVIRKLLGEKMTLTSEHEGMIILKNRLRWKKVLFILDGVNHREQLEFLVGGREWFGMGSRIILTAIDKHLLINHVGDNVYEVQLLSEDEALELFSRHAFKRKSPERDFEELSSEVVKYADGLPLALKVLGSSFYGRNKEQWGDMIDRLKKIPNDDILGKLKIGLNGLNKDEMRIFLDIACLYNHRPRDDVELILKSCGIHMIGISRLIEKSLLSIRNCYRIEMHSLICQMGQNVLREEYANSRIWLVEEVHDLFAGKLKTKKVESLQIPKGYHFEDDHEIHSKVFKRMQSLQVLIIDFGTIFLESTVTCLPSSLRWIDWPYYPSSSLPEIFDPSHLVVLSLYKNRLVEFWPIPRKLRNLKHLALGDSLVLTKTPNFGDMPNLETLILERCSNLEEVHPSLGHCRMLTYLTLRSCVKLKKLPKFVSMESLETLDLLECTSLEEFPEICGDMRRLSKLYVGSPWIRSLPPSLSGLRNLELRDSEVLESIPGTIRNIEYLYIVGCNKLSMLPNSLFESQQLEYLDIFQCSGLVELPISLGVQKKLLRLLIDRCENLKKLPSSIQMESLEELILNSTGIRELPSSIGNLRSLYSVNLKDCEDLKLSNLKLLDLKESLGLSKTPNFGDMPILERLNLERCSNLEKVHPSLGHCRMLTSLNLHGCVKLRKLPKFVTMESLETLNLLECTSLEKFPEICGDMRRLSELYVGSPRIRSLPPSLSGLRRLELRGCEVLENIPDAIQNLESLYIEDCNKLATLPNSLFESQQLEDLKISYCSRLVELPISLGVQKMLRRLEIEGCENLKKLSSSIQMESVEQLKISNSPKLHTFPEIDGDMHRLRELTLNSTGIRELPSSIGNLSGLTELNLKGCEDLVSLPNSLCNLMNLQRLFLCGCKKLEKLPENIGDLQELQILDARETAIFQPPPSITKLGKLEELGISHIVQHGVVMKKCLKLRMLSVSWCGHEKSEFRTVSNEQVNVMKLLQHFLRTCIQCDFNQRDYLLISFPEVGIPELFDYQFINQERMSINLNPSWYTDKFIGFSICYCPIEANVKLVATLVCKSDPERKHSLKYDSREHWFESPAMCCIYIPFRTLWHASGNKEGKNPNDYYLFEVFTRYRNKLCWGIRLEYENKVRSWRRKQQAAQSPKLFSVSGKDDSVTTEIGCSMVLPEPSLASSSRVFTEHNIATDRGLHLGNENKDLEVDEAAMAVQKEPKSQNVKLIRVCGSPSRKMDDASRKRKRKRNRKKKRKMAGTDETSCSHCTK